MLLSFLFPQERTVKTPAHITAESIISNYILKFDLSESDIRVPTELLNKNFITNRIVKDFVTSPLVYFYNIEKIIRGENNNKIEKSLDLINVKSSNIKDFLKSSYAQRQNICKKSARKILDTIISP